VLFADDICITYDGQSEETLFNSMEHDLQQLTMWFESNGLRINLDKSELLIKKKKNLSYTKNVIHLGNDCIYAKSTVKYLGLIIDELLSWEPQAQTIKKKIFPAIGALFRAKKILSQSALKQIYYDLIHSHLIYLINTWGHCNHNLFSQLEILQKRALKIIFNLPERTESSEIFKIANVIPLTLSRDLSCITLAFRSLHSKIHTSRWLRAGVALAKTCPRDQSLSNSARREQSLLRTRPREESLNSDSRRALS